MKYECVIIKKTFLLYTDKNLLQTKILQHHSDILLVLKHYQSGVFIILSKSSVNIF